MAETNLDAVAKMLAAAETDDALQAELSAAKDLPTVVQIGKSRGYDFTAEDVQAVASASSAETDELSDEDLDGVSGGMLMSTAHSFPWLVGYGPTTITGNTNLFTGGGSSDGWVDTSPGAGETSDREVPDAAEDEATLEDERGTKWEEPAPEEEPNHAHYESKLNEESVDDPEDERRPTETAEDSQSAQRESNSADADENDPKSLKN